MLPRLLLHNDAAGVPGRRLRPHCARSGEQGLANRLFYLMLTIWNGAPVTAYVPGHNLSHHKYLQTRRDIMRTNKVNFGVAGAQHHRLFPSILGSIQSNDFKYMQAQRRKGCAAARPPAPLPRRRRRRVPPAAPARRARADR